MVGMELRQQLKLAQQLVMTPQLQQAIKLLQLSRLELVNLASQELQENPLLEESSLVDMEKSSLQADDREEQKERGPEEVKGELEGVKDINWDEYMQNYEYYPRPIPPKEDPGRGVALDYWDPEDESFWSGAGRRIANRNLWISIPNLLCGFAVWLYWSIIIVQMQNLHALGFFPFAEDKSLLYTLPAIAGLAGATLRIPNSFMIAISGQLYLTVLVAMLVGKYLGRSKE